MDGARRAWRVQRPLVMTRSGAIGAAQNSLAIFPACWMLSKRRVSVRISQTNIDLPPAGRSIGGLPIGTMWTGRRVRERTDWDEVFTTAALQPDRWFDALETMAEATRSTHGQLIGVGGARDIPFNIVSNFPEQLLRDFVAMGGGAPDLNFRVAASEEQIARGFYDPILHEQHYDEVVSRLRSRLYLEWCEDVGIPFGCQTNLVVDRVGVIGFALLRSRKAGRTTAMQRAVFRDAAAAARRAVRLQEQLEGQQAQLLAGAFEVINLAAFIIDARGDLLAHTAQADALLSRGDVRRAGPSLDASGKPMSLRQAIQVLLGEANLPYVRLRLDERPDRAPVFIEGFRLPVREWSFGKLPHALLIANSARRDRAGVAAFLSALYRLTEAEADIAMRLYDGKSRAQIAQDRAVTTETLRGQIKSVYAKTGVEGEAGLIRLLTAIMA
ncbi:MAG: helix-turn-helix transcriptional regulator [Sphingomonas sp.]|nr:helix-turn-helix transcriptional regulator [Sphingomonas sp.]